MRTPLNRLITTNVLKQMEGNAWLLEAVLDDPDEAQKVQLKNVCAKVSPQLADEIDSVCGLLSISKRSFIEAAFVEAIRQAHEIINAEGLHEYYLAHHEVKEAS